MRLFTALKKNIVPILFVVLVIGLLIYMTQRKEGFATCNATNCRSRGGSWINNICYRPCSATGVGNAPYQECIIPLSSAQYDEYQKITDIKNKEMHNPTISKRTPCGGGMLGNESSNIRTLNTFCANKLRVRENKARGKIARRRFSSC